MKETLAASWPNDIFPVSARRSWTAVFYGKSRQVCQSCTLCCATSCCSKTRQLCRVKFALISLMLMNKTEICASGWEISVDKKNQLDVTFVFFISLLLVAQHVSGNYMPIIRSWRLRDVIVSCWYVPWLQGGCQVRLAGSASIAMNPSMDALPVNRSWQPSCSHGTYQHKAITSRSRQLLMMGT